ncbi:MAG: dCTP deaminase [Magnetococcales bacterium]|nr:dCTP deaminase [Magnetococcales bacterium]
MRLSDQDVKFAMTAGLIEIDPMPAIECFGSFSVDLTLGNTFKIIRQKDPMYYDLMDLNRHAIHDHSAFNAQDGMETTIVEDHGRFCLPPGAFALGITKERVKIPNDMVGWLDGRSSLARLGLMIHITAFAIDPGWNGKITLEFFNAGPLTLALAPGLRIGAISFEGLSSPSSLPYGSKPGAKYHGQDSPVASRIEQDFCKMAKTTSPA